MLKQLATPPLENLFSQLSRKETPQAMVLLCSVSGDGSLLDCAQKIAILLCSSRAFSLCLIQRKRGRPFSLTLLRSPVLLNKGSTKMA